MALRAKTQNVVFLPVSIDSIFILNRNVCVKEQINNYSKRCASYLLGHRAHSQRTNRRQNKSTLNTKGQQDGLDVFGRCQMT